MANENFKEIWEVLSHVDVTGHVEKKGGLSYLSWAWAWGVLMDNYADAEFKFTTYPQSEGPDLDVMTYADGSCKVECLVTIRGCKRLMWLPVMDYKNNSIKNPSSRQVSDSKMRCLTKALSLFGLGHFLYAGEDTPPSRPGDGQTAEPKNGTAKPSKKSAKKESGIAVAYEVFAQECETMKDLRTWWVENKEELETLESNEPEHYQAVLEVFTERKKTLKEKESQNGSN